MSDSVQSLRSMNVLAAVAHTLGLVGTLVAFSKRTAALKQVTLKRTTVDPAGSTPDQCTINYDVKLVDSGSVNYAYGIASFFAISVLAHLFYAYSPDYKRVLEEGWNPYRWYEYAASAGVMTLLLATADGIREVGYVGSLAAVTAGMQFTGYTTESTLKYKSPINEDTLFGAQLTGWFLFLVIWLSILFAFVKTVQDVNKLPSQAKIPEWLYFVILSQVFYYTMFGLTQRWHITDRKNGFKRFLMHEKRYILLSFLSKITLAGGFAYGLFYRTRNC